MARALALVDLSLHQITPLSTKMRELCSFKDGLHVTNWLGLIHWYITRRGTVHKFKANFI